MQDSIDPKQYGLSARDRLEKLSDNHLALVINRKSRIIMADGKRILQKAEILRTHQPDVSISLKTNAPVCSKTWAFLHDHDIDIITQED